MSTPLTSTHDSIQEFLERDHDRLDCLLAESLRNEEPVDRTSFDEFRKGLLKHIGIEEKLLFLGVMKGGDPEQRATAAKLRLQHGAIASLLVLEPTAVSILALRHVLAIHNPIEEGDGGFYAVCEQLAGPEVHNLLEQIKSLPDVSVATRAQNAQVVESARRSLVRAGFPGSILGE